MQNLMKLKPMLAEPGPATTDYLDRLGPDWTAEIKWDGVRAMLFIDGGTVTIINRALRDITHRYPDVVRGVTEQFVASANLVLDGELVVFENGRPSFPLTAKRDAQSKAATIAQYSVIYPAAFMAFDCIWRDGTDLRALAYTQRANHLEQVIQARGVVAPSLRSKNLTAMWNLVKAQNLEGLILKRDQSHYVHKRSRDWVKCKPMHTISAFVTAVERGQGARASTFGALHLAVMDGDQVKPVGKVGTGFKQADLDEIAFRLSAGQQLVVEVAFQEIGSGGQLRFPSWKGLRQDLTPADCLVSQLPERVQ